MNVLDTNFLIGVLRNQDGIVEALKKVDGQDNVITSITEMELWYGAFKGNAERNRQVTEVLVKSYPVLPFDSESAKIAGKLVHELERRGSKIEFRDAMIAAVALRHNAILITRNLKHFQRVQNLQVQSW